MRFAAFQTSDFCHLSWSLAVLPVPTGSWPAGLSPLVPGCWLDCCLAPACLDKPLLWRPGYLLPGLPFLRPHRRVPLAQDDLLERAVATKKKGRGGEGRLTTTAPATALLLPPLLLRRRRATTTTDDDNADDRRRRTRRGGPEGGSSDSCCCCSRCAATATSSATTCTTTSRCFAAAAAAWPSGRPGRGQAPQGLADTPG